MIYSGVSPPRDESIFWLRDKKMDEKKRAPGCRPNGYPARFPREGLRRRHILVPLRRLAILGFARFAA